MSGVTSFLLSNLQVTGKNDLHQVQKNQRRLFEGSAKQVGTWQIKRISLCGRVRIFLAGETRRSKPKRTMEL
jgi:hypothetical protein